MSAWGEPGTTVLEIVIDDEHRPILYYRGRKFGVLRDFGPHVQYDPVGVLGYQSCKYEFHVTACLLEPEPEPPKPKRRISTALGLRRPT